VAQTPRREARQREGGRSTGGVIRLQLQA
jgi:hypothetical protein